MRNRIIGMVLVLSFLIFSAVPVSFAQQSQATVVPDSLQVRANPGLDTQVIGAFPAGTTVTVTGREDEQGNGGVWVLVSGNGMTGWVLAEYLQFPSDFPLNALPVVAPGSAAVSGASPAESAPAETDTTQEAAPAQAPVQGGNLSGTVAANANVRGGPGTSYNRVGGASAGAPATLVGRSTDGSWLRGNFGGVDGWISAGLVNVNGAINSLPVVGANDPIVAAPAGQTQGESAPASVPANNPPPVAGGGIGGFSYGAHVAHMGNADLMRATGMTWAKIQIRPGRGASGSSYAGTINEAHNLGFRLLLGVVGSPGDIASGEEYFADFARFVGELAAAGVDAVEVWNEPNLDREWPSGQVDPAMYTRLLALSYNAIKSANPNTIVISGALAPTGFFGGCSSAGCDDAVYLQGMRAAGAASYMDCVGAHYNEGVVSPSQTSGDPRSEYYTRYFYGMVNTYVGAIGKPICFTELGYLTPDGYGGMPAGFEWGSYNTLAEHAQWIADAVTLSARNSSVRLVIIWNLNFRTDPSSPDPAGGYAMIRPDGTCPACDALAARR